jgi:hypothetical protein
MLLLPDGDSMLLCCFLNGDLMLLDASQFQDRHGTFSPSATHLIKTCRAKGKTFETLTHFVCLQNAKNQQGFIC